MITKEMKQGLILMALGGMPTLICADVMVTGEKAPDQYQQVNSPATNEFLATHRSTLPSAQDMLQFSAVTMHGDATTSSNPSPTLATSLITAPSPASKSSMLSPVANPAPLAFAKSSSPSTTNPVSADSPASGSSFAPCPTGYSALALGGLNNNSFQCSQTSNLPKNTFATTVTMQYDIQMVKAQPQGMLNTMTLDDGETISYGLLRQFVTFTQPQQAYAIGAVSMGGEYDNYYVQNLQQAKELMSAECGVPVTYMGPALGSDGKPTGYYVVQVVGPLAGDASDYSPVPPWETDLCPRNASSGS